jgi:hypothetical protein
MKADKVLAPVDASWFKQNQEEYLSRQDFIKFQKLTGVDLLDLLSKDPEVVRKAQKKIVDQCVVLNEVQKFHAGYSFPFFVYTHNFEFADKISNHNLEVDKMVLSLDMCDSLRRRHIALSHVLLPNEIIKIAEMFNKPIIIKNYGSGVGIDIMRALLKIPINVEKVLNYEINKDSIKLGRDIVEYLEKQGFLEGGVIEYVRKNFMKSKRKAHMIVAIGIICGLTDYAAREVIIKAYDDLTENGKLIISSANHHMKSTCPLSNILIQHIGTRKDPLKGWGLNFRTKDILENLLSEAGFKEIQIYDDANYPGRETLPQNILHSVEELPAQAKRFKSNTQPISLPPKEIFDRGIGYNWLAIAKK